MFWRDQALGQLLRSLVIDFAEAAVRVRVVRRWSNEGWCKRKGKIAPKDKTQLQRKTPAVSGFES